MDIDNKLKTNEPHRVHSCFTLLGNNMSINYVAYEIEHSIEQNQTHLGVENKNKTNK